MEALSAEVNTERVISDLESEYERSRKFLDDLCRSLEACGVVTRQSVSNPSADSPFVAKEVDGPPSASLQDTAASNPFNTIELAREDSELSNCSSECSTSVPHLPDLNVESNRSPVSHQYPGIAVHNSINGQRRGDPRPIPSAASPLRNRTSGRAGRKQAPVVFSSCPCIDPTQDEGYERAAAAAVVCSGSNLLDNGGPPQRRVSSNQAPVESPVLSQVLSTPPPPVGSHRTRRSSLDFVPAPHAHFRNKWTDGSLLGGGSGQSLPPPPPTPLASSNNSNGLEGNKANPVVKKGSLEVLGWTATGPAIAGGGTPLSSCPSSVSGGGHHSCSGAAPGAGGAGSYTSILSRARRSSLALFISNQQAQSQQEKPQTQEKLQQLQHSQSQKLLQPEQQQQQPHLQQQQSLPPQLGSPGVTTSGGVGSPPMATAFVRLSASRRVTENGQGLPPVGSPGGSSGLSHLPPLLQSAQSSCLPPPLATSLSLTINLPSPNSRGGTEHGGGAGSPIGSSSLIASLRWGSQNGLQPSGSSGGGGGGSAGGAAAPDPPPSPGDISVRAGRFGRCGTPATAMTPSAASSTSALPAASVATAASALLCHGLSGRDRRALSSGEIPERLVPRTALTLCASGLGGGSGNGAGSGSGQGGGSGSPLSARGGRPDTGGAGSPLFTRVVDSASTATAASVATSSPQDLPWQPNGGLPRAQLHPNHHHIHQNLHQQHGQGQGQNQPHHHLQLSLHHYPNSVQPPAATISPVVGVRAEQRTRLGPSGRAAA